MHEVKPLSEKAQSIKPGLYQHFKGGKYEVIGVARHSENKNQEFVVYRSLDHGTLWVRPLAMFLENLERNGYNGPRFKFIK